MFGACDPTAFANDAQRVNDACCDSEMACANGVPQECDAKCAIVYNDFFRRCQSLLGSFNHAQVDTYDRLFTTCSRSLPTEPLLRAAVMCSTAQPEPEPEPEPDLCNDYGCSDHGTCSILSEQPICECTGNSKGQHCSVLMPAGSATGQWATLTPMPTARRYLGVTGMDGILYAIGGSSGSGVYLDTVEAYII